MTRAGFVALAGRPNVGKSTLVNALVGQKVAIVSDKPQTTRRAIRGVATRPGEWQLVLTDLPGVQRPRDALTERMQRRVEHEFAEADAVLLVLNGEQGVGGPGDRFIADALRGAKVPVVVAVNKIDRLDRTRTVAALQAAADLGLDAEVFPISATRGKGMRAAARAPRRAARPRGRSCSRSRRSPTSPSTCGSPSSCASRCCTARARRSRTRSRCTSTRSSSATTSSRCTRCCGSRRSPRRASSSAATAR